MKNEVQDNLQCRICGMDGLRFIRYLHGEFFHRDVPLYECSECHSFVTRPHCFQSDDEISDVFALDWHLLSRDYNRRKADELFRTIRQRGWLTHGPKRLLDIGCGIGQSLIQGERWGFASEGLEPESEAAEYGRTQLNANIKTGYFDRSSYENGSIDVVMLDNVLEHLPEPRKIFHDIIQILRDDGVFFLGVPPAEWIRRWTSISYMAPRQTPAVDWRTFVSRYRFMKLFERLDTFGYPDGHINYFSLRAIQLLCQENDAQVVEQFHPRPIRAKLYPWIGLTTGYYLIRKRIT